METHKKCNHAQKHCLGSSYLHQACCWQERRDSQARGIAKPCPWGLQKSARSCDAWISFLISIPSPGGAVVGEDSYKTTVVSVGLVLAHGCEWWVWWGWSLQEQLSSVVGRYGRGRRGAGTLPVYFIGLLSKRLRNERTLFCSCAPPSYGTCPLSNFDFQLN